MKNRKSGISKYDDCSLADSMSESGHHNGGSSISGRSILLIDDNADVGRAVEIAFRMAGHRVERVQGAQDAYSMLARRRFDAIILDLNFSAGKVDGSEGLACLDRIMADDPRSCVVVLTAHGGIRIAVAAMRSGARDFAVKPWNNANLIAKVETAINHAPIGIGTLQTAKIDAGPSDRNDLSPPARLLGECAAIIALRRSIQRIGPTSAAVTITGKPGSGRTLAALSLHLSSVHAALAPLRVDLRDAAQWDQIAGAQGTLILRHPDLIDETAQHRLLAAIPAHVRIVAIADHVAPITAALMQRLTVVELVVPPLSQRGDDAVLLANHFIRVAAEKHARPQPRLSDTAIETIRNGQWPDEVRGLAMTAERAVLFAESDQIGPEAFAPALPVAAEVQLPANERLAGKFDLDRTEKALIEAALREYGHNISHTAKALGLSRASLYRRMDRHGL